MSTMLLREFIIRYILLKHYQEGMFPLNYLTIHSYSTAEELYTFINCYHQNVNMNTYAYIPPHQRPNVQVLTFTAQRWFNNAMTKMLLLY